LEKCSRCKKKITEETGRNVSIHRKNFQYGNILKTIYCNACHKYNRKYKGRTTEEIRLEAKTTCKVFSQKEIDAVTAQYNRRCNAS